MGSIRFSLREHKSYAAYPVAVDFSKPDASTVRIHSPEGGAPGRLGKGYAFIVAPRAWLNGKYLRFNISGHFGAAVDRIVNEVLIYDGEYDRSSDVDFPSGSTLLLKGNGLLQTVLQKNFHGFYGPETHDILINVAGGSEEKCTIFFQLNDGWSANYDIQFDIHWFEINTGAGGSGPLYDEQFTDTVHMEVTGTQGDYGYISDGEVVGPAAPTVVTLDAGELKATEATLNGNITVCYPVADERGFEWGTTPGAYPGSWTEAGTFGTGTFSHTITGLDEGVPYYYRAKAHNALGWGYGAEKTFTPGAAKIELRLTDVEPPKREPERTLYRDIASLPSPVKLGITVRYFNFDDVGLYFQITGSAAGYTFGTVNLNSGAVVGSGTDKYENLDEFASRAKPSVGDLPGGEMEENITLILKAYSDPGYTTLKWTFERVVTVHWINNADAAFTQDVLNDFDDGTVQGWSKVHIGPTVSYLEIVTDYVLSAPYSLRLRQLYQGSPTDAHMRSYLRKSFTTPNRDTIFAIIDTRQTNDDAGGCLSKYIKIQKDETLLIFIGRPYDTVFEDYIPKNRWMRIVVPLPKNVTVELRIVHGVFAEGDGYAHNAYIWLEDFRIVSK